MTRAACCGAREEECEHGDQSFMYRHYLFMRDVVPDRPVGKYPGISEFGVVWPEGGKTSMAFWALLARGMMLVIARAPAGLRRSSTPCSFFI